MRKKLGGNLDDIRFIVIVFSLTLLITTQIIIVTAQEEELFSWSGNLAWLGTNKQHFSSYLKTSERVNLVLSAPETVKVYIHSSDDYDKSGLSGWLAIYSHWSTETAQLNYTYNIPFTDTWYFTVYDYKTHDVYVSSFVGYKVIPPPSSSPSPSPSSPNPPVWLLIVSGVIGAIVASAIITFYFLRIRKRP